MCPSQAQNRLFKAALQKPRSPSILLDAVKKTLGWTDKGTLLQPSLNYNVRKGQSRDAGSFSKGLSDTQKLDCPLEHFLSSIYNDKPLNLGNNVGSFKPPKGVLFTGLPQLHFLNGLHAFRRGCYRLSLIYCPHQACSEPLRRFISSRLCLIRRANPDVLIDLIPMNGRKPFLRSRYVSGVEHVIGLGVKSTMWSIEEHVKRLLERSGERFIAGRRFSQAVFSERPKELGAVKPIWAGLMLPGMIPNKDNTIASTNLDSKEYKKWVQRKPPFWDPLNKVSVDPRNPDTKAACDEQSYEEIIIKV